MKELWVPVSGAIAQQKSVETIANNIANANTPGFKKDELTFREYITALDKGYDDIDLPNKEFQPKDFYHSYGAEHAKVKVDGSYTIFEQGQLTPTGNPLDLALKGQGMLEVLTPNGIRYTRSGSLSVSPEGYLINTKGHYILKDSKDPDPKNKLINVGNTSFNINFQGQIFVGGAPTDQISIKEFKDLHALKKEGGQLFVPNDPANVLEKNTTTSIHQGYIEQSNVNAVAEMAKLIKANRQFESIQKAIKTYDQISSKGTNELLKF
ncbi:MAG: flagellar hook-basal body protein [Bacteriovoracaceae bacterium]